MARLALDENPFDLTKASNYSDSQILDYWVDLAGEGGLLGIIRPKMPMPLFLLGSKGCGKTHLMRYCSAPVRAMYQKSCVHDSVIADGYLGIYTIVNGLNDSRFSGKGVNEETWLNVFAYYFELWLATHFVSTIDSIMSKFDEDIDFQNKFCHMSSDLFAMDVKTKFSSFSEFRDFLTSEQKKIDFAVMNCAISRKLEGIEILFAWGKLIYGLPAIIGTLIPDFSKTLFVYLIDEVENFCHDSHQEFLNSLIRYRTGNVTFKIGARLYGIRSYNTINGAEPIKQNAEYERIELDSILRDSENYEDFAKKLISIRLKPFSLTVPVDDNGGLSACFSTIKSDKYYSSALESFLEKIKSTSREWIHFQDLTKKLIRKGICQNTINQIISEIRIPDYPLLEKLNIMLLYRQWKKPDLLLEAQKISEAARAMMEGKPDNKVRYSANYGHYDLDLLAQIYRDFQRKYPYCGADALIHLSQGVPRNLLGALKNIYRRSFFRGEHPFAGMPISIDAQLEAISDTATWFWDDAQPDQFGNEVRFSIELLATLFREFRYSDIPNEPSICAFSIDPSQLTETSQMILGKCEAWSYLIRLRDGRKNKNVLKIDAAYQLNPILAPKWGLSIHRRGVVELNPSLANSIFDKDQRPRFEEIKKKRIARLNIETTTDDETVSHPGLFDNE